MDEEVTKDDELENRTPEADELIDEDNPKKPKNLLDDESVISADDIEEEELDVEEPFDDVDET